MNNQQPTPPVFINVDVIRVDKDDENKIISYKMNAAIPLPNVGDEMCFPSATQQLEMNIPTFKIVKRVFPVPINQVFFYSVLLFVLPVEKAQDAEVVD